MAPVFSKAAPRPPTNPKEAIAQAVDRARPLLDSMFELIQETTAIGRICYSEVAETLERISRQVDRFFVCTAGLLENYCCLDFHRGTRGPRRKMPLQGNLPILFVLMLLVMLYNAFVFGYMPAMRIAVNSRTSLIFHAWIFLVLASFVQAVNTDPGTVPDTAEWKTYGCPPPECRERKRGTDEARWCRKSEAYKPDRAHFCRVSGQSVLRMDHHCPWLGNTIGFYNHKYFFLFLLYTNAACAQLGVSIIQLLVQATLPALTTFLLIGAEGLTALLTTILVPFLCFHFWLLVRNMTTIEFCEKLRTKEDDEPGAHDQEDNRSMYDLGLYRNFCAVLGNNPLLWLLPIGGPPGDGISFPLRRDLQKALRDKERSSAKAVVDATDATDACEEDLELGGKQAPEATHPVATEEEDEEEAEDEVEEAKAKEYADEDEGVDVANQDCQASSSKTKEPLRSSKAKHREKADQKLEGGLLESALNEDTDVDSLNEDVLSVAASTAPSEGESFLLWHSPKEFAEDLTIGCQFLGEKLCPMDTIWMLATSCLAKTLKQKAPQQIEEWRKQRQSVRAARASKVVAAPGGGRLLDDDSGSSCSSDHQGSVGHDYFSS